MNISILYGGASSEHKISIQTGIAIAESIKGIYNIDLINLKNDIYQTVNKLSDVDLVFNALHGGDGENGKLQAYLELNEIEYTGSNSKACQIAMDKNLSKHIAKSIGISTPNWMLVKRQFFSEFKLENHWSSKFSYPYVIKPSNEGSTYGLSIVNEEGQLADAVGAAFEFSNEIIIEEYIPGKELTVGILGNKPLPIIEIKPSKELYDYECKYTKGMSEYFVPANLDNSLSSSLMEDALKIYNTIGCRHYARADFRMNDDGKYYFLEINTLPGMTSNSLLPKAAKAGGLGFSELITTIIKIATLKY